jgi:hypothetical protein
MIATAEIYHPSEWAKTQGRWAVVHEKFVDGEPDWSSTVHIIPTFGQHHEISTQCWCGPYLSGEDKDVVNHKASQ